MRKLLKLVGWLVALGSLTFLVWVAVRPETRAEPVNKPADGEGVEHLSFGKGNKKQIKFRASRQRNADNNESYYDEFVAEIEPKNANGEIITASSDLAFVFNSAFNIELKGHVRIESPTLLLTGPYLLLKDQNHLSSDQTMEFRIRDISGTAAKGLVYSMVDEVVKLFAVKGKMMKDGILHDFSCRELTLDRGRHLLHLAGQIGMDGGGKVLSCERLSITFDDQMREIQKVAAVENVRLVSRADSEGKGVNRYEFTSGRMGATYTGGVMDHSELRENAELSIKTPAGEITSNSEVFVCRVDPQSGNLRAVDMPVKGEWTYRAPDGFFFTSANQGRFLFDEEGELNNSEAKGEVDFKIDEYTGGGDRLVYQPRVGKARVSGPGTWIKKKGRLVYGKGGIDVDTKKNELSSDNWVLSSVTMKGRPPFGSEPVMINARSVTLLDRENRIRYSGSVVVSQDKLKLLCGNLLLADEELTAEQDVVFSFQGKDGPVTLRGDTLRIQGRTEPVITLSGQAQAFVGDKQIAAKLITLKWDKRGKDLQTLLAENGVRFIGGTYQTDSDNLNWDLEREMMNFRGRVTIRREGAFESRGEEVEINVRTQELRILTRSAR
jgi:lipopolysaccharide export system protein LptA